MAVNLTPLVLDACSKTVSSVTRIVDALDTLEDIKEQLDAGQIDLLDYTEEIEAGDGISHCDPATLKFVINDISLQIVTAMKAYYSGTPTQQAWGALLRIKR